MTSNDSTVVQIVCTIIATGEVKPNFETVELRDHETDIIEDQSQSMFRNQAESLVIRINRNSNFQNDFC